MSSATRGRRARLVVLNYNGGEFVQRSIRHIHQLDWPAADLEIVLVDNASTDGSVAAIQAEFPDVAIIRNATNQGFPANNLALRDLDGLDYVGLVNNDGFVEPGWLRALADTLDADPALGAAAARMVFEPKFVDVIISAPTFVPGIGDSRALAVMVSGLRVDGEDRWPDAHFAEGAWGVEQGRGGTFQWTSGHAVLRIPIPSSWMSGDALPETVELRIEAESPKKVTFISGSREHVVEASNEAEWITVPVDGMPYDVIQNAGSMVFEDGAGADRGFLQADVGQFDEPADVFAWCGGSVLWRPEYVRETGCFDERFFLYYEDTDWAWRGRARGWNYRYVPTAVMRHLHAASTGEGHPIFVYHVERNRLLMLVKNAPAGLALKQIIRYVLTTASYGRRDVVGPMTRRRRPNTVTTRRRVKAFLGFARLAPAMVASRRQMRAAQTVPDQELMAWLVKR